MLGMYFGDYHSYSDLNLILSSVDIPPATPKTVFVDIPGGDGSIDLSSSLGRVRFNDRDCSFRLTVFPSDDFEEKKREVCNRINGQKLRIILDKDPDFYYVGRCSVSEYNSTLYTIIIHARVSPYKFKVEETVQEYPAGVSGQQKLFLSCGVPVIPTIITVADCVLTFGGGTYNMNAGTHTIPDFEMLPGENLFGLESSGKVTIKYQERDL